MTCSHWQMLSTPELPSWTRFVCRLWLREVQPHAHDKQIQIIKLEAASCGLSGARAAGPELSACVACVTRCPGHALWLVCCVYSTSHRPYRKELGTNPAPCLRLCWWESSRAILASADGGYTNGPRTARSSLHKNRSS